MLGFEDCFIREFENKNNLIGKISHIRVPANIEKGFNFKSIISQDELKALYKVFGRKVEDRWIKTQHYYNSMCKNV